MAIDTDARGHVGAGPEPATELRFIYAVGFVLCLTAAVLSRLLPWRWSARRAGAEARRSILAEARSGACKTIPVSFMG